MSSVIKNLCGIEGSELYDELREVVNDCCRWLSEDGKAVPEHQRAWKIGSTFSWHYVKNAEYRIAQLIKSIEDITMARSKNGTKKAFDPSGYTFVKCELTADDKKAAKVWIEENTGDMGPMLHDIMASDYKFTCSFSPDFDTFTACLVGKETQALNPQKTLTARHKDWVAAAMTVLYKHAVMFKSGVWIAAEVNEDDGWG
jgi:hypothetical protein